MSDAKTVGIIGAGQMGCGIAHVFALSGFRVLLNDISQDRIEAGIATITGNMGRQIASGKLAEADSEAALARIHPATNLGAMAEVDYAKSARCSRPMRLSLPIHLLFPSPAWRRRPIGQSNSSACIS